MENDKVTTLKLAAVDGQDVEPGITETGKKKHDKKTKEEIQQERFWRGCPTRAEVSEYVTNVVANELSPVLYSLSINIEALKAICMDTGMFTQEQLQQKLEDVVNQMKGIPTEEPTAPTDTLTEAAQPENAEEQQEDLSSEVNTAE